MAIRHRNLICLNSRKPTACASPFFIALFLILTACTSQGPDLALQHEVFRGDLGLARARVAENLTQSRTDRRYLLDRMKLGIITLADGYPLAAERVFNDVYDVLRTQGINADKTVASVVINEGVKFWKGEPFEQAMAMCYVGMNYATLGDYGNLRAAAESSLFQLRDFGNTTAEQLATRAANEDSDDVINTGYKPVRSNFTLGYLLSAVANQQLGAHDEARDRFKDALAIDPGLADLVTTLKRGEYNALFVVDFGQGPQKVGTGPDNAVARFITRTGSDTTPLVVVTNGASATYPRTLDLNRIATDLMWNNLEDIRLAKSAVGSALMTAGALTTAIGADQNSNEAVFAGIGMIAAGALARAGAHADTRYCEILPQRVYLAPATIRSPTDTITLAVGGASLTLVGITPPQPGEGALFRYIRLPHRPPPQKPGNAVLYANTYAPGAGNKPYPWILGGHDVSPPDAAALNRYRAAGFLGHLSPGDLQDIYRTENIDTDAHENHIPGIHLLEGGSSMACPLPGTWGYARLMCSPHPPYVPHSPLAAQLKASLNNSPTNAPLQ